MQDPLAGLGAQAAPSASQRNTSDPFGDLTEPSPPATAAAGWPTATVYQKNGITITFDFSKPPGNPSLTDIKATYTGTGGSPVTNFSLQVHNFPCFPLHASCKGAHTVSES